MDDDQGLMVFGFPTDAMKRMINDAKIDGDVLLNDVHLELEDDDHDVMHAKIDGDVPRNDVHLELEDDDHDVIHAKIDGDVPLNDVHL